MINIEFVSPEVAVPLCRKIIADLPEYFGLPDCNEHYISGLTFCENLALKVDENFVALLSLNFPYPNNANIFWMGIQKEFHRNGFGKLLVQTACNYAHERGAKTITVETLAPDVADENYLKTYKFYTALGFEPLFNLKPENYVWDMVYMIRNTDPIK